MIDLADTVLKRTDLENIFWRETMIILGCDPDSELNSDKVRTSWPTGGAPAWKINEDIVFIRIIDLPDPITLQRETSYAPENENVAKKRMSYTRVHSVMWTFYGPNSYDNACLMKDILYMSEVSGEFKKSNLYLVPDAAVPIRAPELFQGQWWDRTDFAARYNELVIREGTVNYIESAEVKLYTEKGEVK